MSFFIYLLFLSLFAQNNGVFCRGINVILLGKEGFYEPNLSFYTFYLFVNQRYVLKIKFLLNLFCSLII